MKKVIIPIVIGLLLVIVGAGMMVYGYTRDEFTLDCYELENYEKEIFTYSKEEVTEIVFEGQIENLSIISTDENEYTIEGKKSESLTYEYTLNDGTLKIKQNWVDKVKSLFSFGETNITTPFIIYVPNEALNNLKITVNVGDVNISNIKLNDLTLNINTGDLDIESCNITSVSADVDTGDVDINVLNCNNITAEVNVGDLDIISTDTAHISSKVNTGSIYYSGKITSSGDFKCNVGDIDLDLSGSDYKVDGVGNGNAVIETKVDLGESKYNFK